MSRTNLDARTNLTADLPGVKITVQEWWSFLYHRTFKRQSGAGVYSSYRKPEASPNWGVIL